MILEDGCLPSLEFEAHFCPLVTRLHFKKCSEKNRPWNGVQHDIHNSVMYYVCMLVRYDKRRKGGFWKHLHPAAITRELQSGELCHMRYIYHEYLD